MSLRSTKFEEWEEKGLSTSERIYDFLSLKDRSGLLTLVIFLAIGFYIGSYAPMNFFESYYEAECEGYINTWCANTPLVKPIEYFDDPYQAYLNGSLEKKFSNYSTIIYED